MKITEIPEAVVLANGEYPQAAVPSKILSLGKYVVCCDGAANRYIEEGFTPDAIIGDGDSLKEEYKERYAEIVHRISEQDSNDQTKAIRYLLSQGKRHIAIVGATGKREDHTLGNISLLMEYACMGANVRSYTDYGVFIPCCGVTEIEVEAGQQISIFNFTAKNLKADGLQYPIYCFTNWWQGTLNSAIADKITIEGDGQYLLFVNY